MYNNSEKIIPASNQKHIDAYIEYCTLVGDNGGKIMSQIEYEEYKKNYAKLAQNRVYLVWMNPEKVECKVVGPSTKCFCDHYFKNHDFLQAKDNKIKCKTNGCSCNNFVYIPTYGSQDFKCSCKHSYQLHNLIKKSCKNCACKQFTSTWSCQCGYKYSEHKNIVEKKQERQERGVSSHPINGGIVSYSSMLDGVDRYSHEIDSYLKENPDKKIKPVELKVGNKSFQPKSTEITAYQLYNTPLMIFK